MFSNPVFLEGAWASSYVVVRSRYGVRCGCGARLERRSLVKVPLEARSEADMESAR